MTNKLLPHKAAFFWAIALCAIAHAQAKEATAVDQMMSTIKQGPVVKNELSVVRQTALRDSATVFGAREGLRVQSCLIRSELEKQRVNLDKRFRFGDLLMGRGVLPPVISEARDSVVLEATVMRVASRVYHLDEGARIVDIPPTWRDWLYVGLSTDDCAGGPVDVPTQEQLKPQNPQEEVFFKAILARSYEMGVQQARDVLAANLARLERAYFGMRRYFDLYSRGMVSAPVIASDTDVVVRDDPNTLVVGNTVIRITVPVGFVEKTSDWRPLGE